MSENFIIFLIGGICTVFINVAVFSFKLGSFKESIKNQIAEELFPKLDKLERIDEAINKLENSIIELTAKLEMNQANSDHQIQTVNERISNLKLNAQSKFVRLRATVNELINFINKYLSENERRIFIERSRETIPPTVEEWTKISKK